jgi:hypothetical protein
MSAPIHLPKDLDPALMYAPRHVREPSRHLDPWTDSEEPEDWSQSEDLYGAPEFSGDRAIPGGRRRSGLDPEWTPEPAMMGNRKSWVMSTLRLGGLLAFAAIVACVVISAPAAKLWVGNVITASFSGNGTSASVAAASYPSPRVVKVLRVDRPASDSDGTARQPRIVHQSGAESQADATPGGSLPPSTLVVASAAPTAVATARETRSPVEATDFVSRHVERKELDAMLERADGFIKSGDLSSARLLLRRAAEAGDMGAAFRLAGTFDPNVLKELGLRDSTPDLSQARLWYSRAAKLGSTQAARRLQQLATGSDQ